jgi:hypothetical protein
MKSTSYPDFVTAKLGTLDETTRADCQRWLADLPDGTVVQSLATQVVFEHMTLAGTRAKIARLKTAIGELSERPQPTDDIKERVRRYVTELGRGAHPAVHGTGVGWNEKLAVTWPHDLSMVQLMAALVPEQLARERISRRRNAPGLDQHGARGEGIGARDHRPKIPPRWPSRAALEF